MAEYQVRYCAITMKEDKENSLNDLNSKALKPNQGYCISILIILLFSFVLDIYSIYVGQYVVSNLALVAVMVVITILMILDREALKLRYPDQKIFNGFSVLIVPLYLFLRSRFLGEKQYFLSLWILLMLIGTGISYLVEEAYANLPSCVDQYVMWNLKNIVALNGYEFIDMKNIQQLSVDTEQYIRVCQGSVSIAETGTETVQYKISWIEKLGDWKIEYIVD